MKCTACESSTLIEGQIITGGTDLAFSPLAIPRLKRAMGIGARKVRAYACLHCHHLQFMVDFTDEDRQQYQQFEGQQPSVLERLGANSQEEGSAQQRLPTKKGKK